jgi:predicted metalloprotease
LEIKNKRITHENEKFVQNLQGAFEKEQKLKIELQNKKDENNEILAELQTAK